MVRDSAKTKQRILEAVGTVLAKRGFRGLGINAVARAARVDKVLIYRYFGGMRELLRACSQQGELWPTVRELTGMDLKELSEASLSEYSIAILLGHLRALRARPKIQEIMRWELQQRNELTDELARAREQQGMDLLSQLPEGKTRRMEVDLPAVAAVLHAGLTYLTLRSRTADVYLGVDLRSPAGWKRLERAIETVVRAVTDGR